MKAGKELNPTHSDGPGPAGSRPNIRANAPRPKKIHAIQYLRAVAAFAVVTFHVGQRTQDLPNVVAHWLPLGHAGVDLFFVISGFIMWTVSHTRETEPVDFLKHRLVRVAPLYWVATMGWVIFVPVLGLSWVVLSPGDVLQSMAFIPHFSGTFPDEIWPVLVPGWTLNFEMYFYLLFAATLLISDRLRLGVLAIGFFALVLIGALTAPGSAVLLTYTSPLLLEFLGGCFVAALWSARPGGPGRNVLAFAAGLAVLLVFGHMIDVHDEWQRAVVFGGAAVLIVSGLAGLSDALPRWPLLERLGDASYSVYLFHLFLVVPLAEIWSRLPIVHHPMSQVLFMAVSLLLVGAGGLAVFRYLERPLQRFVGGYILADNQPARPVTRY